jgi:hypothetical protein
MTTSKPKIHLAIRNNILIVTLPETYGVQEVITSIQTFLDSHELDKPIGALMDLTNSKEQRSSDDLRSAFGNWAPVQRRIARFAILVNSDLHFALTRQMAVYGKEFGMELAPFKDRKAALAWLSEDS